VSGLSAEGCLAFADIQSLSDKNRQTSEEVDEHGYKITKNKMKTYYTSALHARTYFKKKGRKR